MYKILLVLVILTGCGQQSNPSKVNIHVTDVWHNPIPNATVTQRFITNHSGIPVPMLTDKNGYTGFSIAFNAKGFEIPMEITVESPEIISQTLTIIPLKNQTTTVEFRVFRKP